MTTIGIITRNSDDFVHLNEQLQCKPRLKLLMKFIWFPTLSVKELCNLSCDFYTGYKLDNSDEIDYSSSLKERFLSIQEISKSICLNL
jgi:hypothetical protein